MWFVKNIFFSLFPFWRNHRVLSFVKAIVWWSLYRIGFAVGEKEWIAANEHWFWIPYLPTVCRIQQVNTSPESRSNAFCTWWSVAWVRCPVCLLYSLLHGGKARESCFSSIFPSYISCSHFIQWKSSEKETKRRKCKCFVDKK